MSYVPATMTTHYPGQQQVVVVQQHAPIRQGPRVYDKFACGQSKALGVTQIVMGILAIFFNALAIHFGSENHNGDEGFANSGMGIWSGLWFILTGSFGIGAAQSKTMCPIVTFMVLSIICVSTWNLAFLGLAAGGVGVTADSTCDYYFFTSTCERNDALLAMMVLLLIICLAEFVVAIWSAVICCSAVCCCDRSNATAPVQYVGTTQAGQVMILQNGATGYTVQQGGTTVMTNTQYPATGYPQNMAYGMQPYQTNPVQPNTNLSAQPQHFQPQQPPPGAPVQPSSSNPPAIPAPPSYEHGPPPAYAPPPEKQLY